MDRPKHVYVVTPEPDLDSDSHSSGTRPSSSLMRRIPSYRPLPIPGHTPGPPPPATTSTTAATSTLMPPMMTPGPSTSMPRSLSPSAISLSIPKQPSMNSLKSTTGHRPSMMTAERVLYGPRAAAQPPLLMSSRSSTASTPAPSPPSLSTSSTTMTSVTTIMPLTTETSTEATTTTATSTSPSPPNCTSTSKSSSTINPTSTSTPALTSTTTPTPPTTPAHKLTRKSRSRLNLKSQSSRSTLRPKRSAATLKPPQSPSEEILSKRAYNSNPGKVFVNRLPPELLSTIFLLLISAAPFTFSSSSGSAGTGGTSEIWGGGGGIGVIAGTGGVDTKAPRMISQVCHLWRCVALNEPLLWARTLNLREGSKWIIETLKRSGECTIDVVGLRESFSSSSSSSILYTRSGSFDGSGGGGGSGSVGGLGLGRVVGRNGSVLGVVLNELKRIRKLHLTIERKEEWRWFVDVLCRSEAPVLESLAVKSLVRRVANIPPGGINGHGHGHSSSIGGGLFGSGQSGFGSHFDGAFGGGSEFVLGSGGGGAEDVMRLTEGMFKSRAPKLKNLSLSMVALSTVTPLPWLSNLTTLQVTDLEDQYLMCAWSWLSIVRQTPLLSSLILRNVFANETPPSPPSDTQNVVLKKLRFIELKGTMMESCEFLEKLIVPGECKLSMSVNRANNAHAAGVLGGWLRERKMRSEHMEGILRTPMEVNREIEREKRRGRWLLVHPSLGGLRIKVNEVFGELGEGGEKIGVSEEDEGVCVVNLALSFGFHDQSEERHRLVIEIFDVLTRALQMVYEDKGGFDALNLSLFGVRDGIKIWGDELVQFLAGLDRIEHLQEVSGYTASVVFPLLVQTPQQYQHQRRGSAASVTSATSTSPAERFRQNVLLPSLSKITLAFVEFAKNVDDEFEACCDVCAVPDFVKRRYGLGKEVGGISVFRQRVGSLKVRFECCSGPKSILDELKKLGVEYGLGWACDFEDT